MPFLALLAISCSKEDGVDEQSFDCPCEVLPVYDPGVDSGIGSINIRPCWEDNELEGAARAEYLEELLDMPKSIALQIAKSQGCEN